AVRRFRDSLTRCRRRVRRPRDGPRCCWLRRRPHRGRWRGNAGHGAG
ncbi:MAG: hypothetical protein AVDCRST_MAG40-319, partial [uncultured Gemmatimonadaceae bacterium]